MSKLLCAALLVLLMALAPALLAADGEANDKEEEEESPSRLSDERKPIQELPARPAPLLEIGDPFLDIGEISEGFRVPGGAIWQPRLMVFGDARASFADWQRNSADSAEFIGDARLFANLSLTATERILVGINPFSRDGRYTGRRFKPNDDSFEQYNAEVDTLFFEGDFGELFPALDVDDNDALDLGFSLGRQQFGPEFNDGFVINDRLDMLGLTRNTIIDDDFSNLRITGIFAWGDIHRGGNRRLDSDALLFGLHASGDRSFDKEGRAAFATIDFDVIYVASSADTGDGLYLAGSTAQRFATGLGQLNTTLRIAASQALEHETAAVRDGQLLFLESSLYPRGSHNLLYFNAYWGIGEFSSAARDPRFAGVLAPVGIAFAEVGLGAVPPALSSNPAKSLGAALGWQIFSEDKRRNLILETAAQAPSRAINLGAVAFAARLQQAFATRFVATLEGSWTLPHGEQDRFALRAEFLVKF